MQMLVLLFLFRLEILKNIEEAEEHKSVWGTGKVMEENMSHELLRQNPNPSSVFVYNHFSEYFVSPTFHPVHGNLFLLLLFFIWPFLCALWNVPFHFVHCQYTRDVLPSNQVPLVMASCRTLRRTSLKGCTQKTKHFL